MNAFIVMILAASAVNLLNASLLIYAAILNMRAARLNRQTTEILTARLPQHP